MKVKKTLLWLCILIVVLSTFFGATNKATLAQGSSTSDMSLFSRLDEILVNQKTILDNLAQMKEELRIIKIRITQQQ